MQTASKIVKYVLNGKTSSPVITRGRFYSLPGSCLPGGILSLLFFRDLLKLELLKLQPSGFFPHAPTSIAMNLQSASAKASETALDIFL